MIVKLLPPPGGLARLFPGPADREKASCQRDVPAYMVQVFLDGAKCRRCIEADDERGYVVEARPGWQRAYEKREGVVRIELDREALAYGKP